MKKIILTTLTLILLAGCASNRSGSTEQSKMKDVPEWFLILPDAEDAIYGVGSAKKQNPSLAKKAATARARDDIASTVKTKVGTIIEDFMDEAGVGENARARELTVSVSKQVSSVSLSGSKIIKVYPANDGTIYVLVEYSLNGVRDVALQEVRKHEALYNEFKAEQGFDKLENAIKNLE